MDKQELLPDNTGGTWHCRNCIELSHSTSCVSTGEPGTDETHLIPCSRCPRLVHPDLVTAEADAVGDKASSSLSSPTTVRQMVTIRMVDSGEWLCSRCCCAAGDDDDDDNSDVTSADITKVLSSVATSLRGLPTAHWGSVFGSRLESYLHMQRRASVAFGLDPEEISGMAQAHGSVDDAQRRLDFVLKCDQQSNKVKPAAGVSAIGSASPTGGGVDELKLQFLRRGYVTPTRSALCIPGETVELLHQIVMSTYSQIMYTIQQRDLIDVLTQAGFRTFKPRGVNRFDLTIPALDDFAQLCDDAPWLPLVRAILGDDIKRLSTSCVLSLPGSDAQQWHSDGQHMNGSLYLPPHCLNVFVPLCDITPEIGPTEFSPGTHVDYEAAGTSEAPCMMAGQPLLFDHRTKHRGVQNRSSSPRPMLCKYALVDLAATPLPFPNLSHRPHGRPGAPAEASLRHRPGPPCAPARRLTHSLAVAVAVAPPQTSRTPSRGSSSTTTSASPSPAWHTRSCRSCCASPARGRGAKQAGGPN